MLLAGHVFQNAADKEQPKHVGEEMQKSGMQENVGKYRPGLIDKKMQVGHKHQRGYNRWQEQSQEGSYDPDP